MIYSPYEQTRRNELAAEFPDLSDSLTAIADRLADLLPMVRSAVYFPAAGFSNSLKSVVPALCPEFIADGLAASAAFLQLAAGALTDAQEIDRVRPAVRMYCQRDMLALVEMHRWPRIPD